MTKAETVLVEFSGQIYQVEISGHESLGHVFPVRKLNAPNFRSELVSTRKETVWRGWPWFFFYTLLGVFVTFLVMHWVSDVNWLGSLIIGLLYGPFFGLLLNFREE